MAGPVQGLRIMELAGIGSGCCARAASQDIEYVTLSSALHGYGRKGKKRTPTINMIGGAGDGPAGCPPARIAPENMQGNRGKIHEPPIFQG